MNKLIFAGIALATVLSMTGCSTTSTRRIAPGEETEVTAQVSEADIRIFVSKTIQDIDKASVRYEKPGARRVINVKPTTVDTTARGSQVGYLAETITACFQEELMNGGKFIVYDESFASQTGAAPIRPEFVMISKLREQNVRLDNGDFYKEYSLLVKLIDAKTSLQFWQKRIPMQKLVDEGNVL